jgi:Cu/Zn superoxide dismutase
MRVTFAVSVIFLCTIHANAGERASLKVDLKNGSGMVVGSAEFFESLGGDLYVSIDATQLPPGEHLVGIHVGSGCQAPSFEDVGPILSRSHQQNRSPNQTRLMVSGDGTGHAHINSDLSITNPARTVMAHTLVVDARVSDDVSHAAGGSGERLACGEIPNLRHELLIPSNER